ncbi:MAG: hypothetical protein AAF420_02100 [Pseudomonadota bacterium]
MLASRASCLALSASRSNNTPWWSRNHASNARAFVTQTNEFWPADYFKPTVGNEYNDHKPTATGGMATPNKRLARMLGEHLLDNKGAVELERYTVSVSDSMSRSERDERKLDADGVLYRFIQSEESAGYFGYDAGGVSRYTVLKVGFDVIPFESTIRHVTPTPDRQVGQ